ncbi:MAG: hypothetical protein Q8N74_03615 [Sulfuricella sp.]|nr:hypothetical protein [Sulfuricella sp.]
MTDVIRPETLAREIVVRYRGVGHVRFTVPAVLCAEPFATSIEESLLRQTGVYRVTLYRRQGKLSVFYDPHACELHDVARGLHGALGALDKLKAQESVGASMVQRLRAANPISWFKAQTERVKTKVEEWRFKAKLLKQIMAYHPQMQNVFSERAAINFANDLVIFYLIKVHWDLITQKWLKQPFKYRNAWLTSFYLVFLLVRYRKQPAKKP